MSNSPQPVRLLLVDDDPALLRGLVRSLDDHNFDVETASCAAEAGVFLKRYPFDVIICDQNMPGMSGLDFLTKIRKEYPDLIVMMLSGHIKGLPVAMKWARDIGVYEVFSKPCDPNQIAHIVCMATRSRQYSN